MAAQNHNPDPNRTANALCHPAPRLCLQIERSDRAPLRRTNRHTSHGLQMHFVHGLKRRQAVVITNAYGDHSLAGGDRSVSDAL